MHSGSDLQPFVNNVVSVITNDGRVILGTLKGYDQTTNLILASASERVFSEEGVDTVPLGLYIIRGDCIGTIGLVNQDLDEGIDWSSVKAPPLSPLRGLHH